MPQQSIVLDTGFLRIRTVLRVLAVMLSEAKHLWIIGLVCRRASNQRFRFAQNDNRRSSTSVKQMCHVSEPFLDFFLSART